MGSLPEVASRMHVEAILPVTQQAMQQANATPQDIDAVAVTRGPGLAGSLLVGVNLQRPCLRWNKRSSASTTSKAISTAVANRESRPDRFPGVVPDRLWRAHRTAVDDDHGKYTMLAIRWTTRQAKRSTR